MLQKVAKDESQVIQWKAGRASHRANDGALFLRYAPWQTLWTALAILDSMLSPFAPFAHCFIADAIAPGDDTCRLR